MKKIISALLICMLAAVCLFTGCSKAKGLKVKDSSGNDRVLVTDENGKPVYDKAGNIVVVDTDEKGKAKKDENGEQATNAIALDYLLVSGKNAYCRYFTFTQPSGYDMSAVGTAITPKRASMTSPPISARSSPRSRRRASTPRSTTRRRPSAARTQSLRR